MKTFITLLVTLLITITSFGQNGINYKAVIKDDLGNIVANQPIGIKFIISEGLGQVTVYEEEQYPTTDSNGIIIVNIGEGNDLSGNFHTIDWGINTHYLKTEMDITGGNNFQYLGPATEFKAVPYSKYADKAANVSGLEQITENDGTSNRTGWRLIGANPAFYVPIGYKAVDLSYSNSSTLPGGALGNYSTAMGYTTKASGIFSTAMGRGTKADAYCSIAIGSYNVGGGIPGDPTNPHSTSNWVATDPIFEIGNGSNSAYRSNALTVLKNGKIGVNTIHPTSLLEVLHPNGVPTTSNQTNAFGIRNWATHKSWQFYTHETGYLELYADGVHKGSFNPSSGVYATVSDRRLKKDITPLDNGTLQKVLQLNPVSYLMKDQTDTSLNLGLISQEVQELFPSITHYNKEEDILILSYAELIPILIKALQEQQTIIDNQNLKIQAQALENTQQNTNIDSLMQRMNALEAINY